MDSASPAGGGMKTAMEGPARQSEPSIVLPDRVLRIAASSSGDGRCYDQGLHVSVLTVRCRVRWMDRVALACLEDGRTQQLETQSEPCNVHALLLCAQSLR